MITSIKSWKQIKSFQLLYLYSKKAFVMIDMNEALQDYVKIKDRNKGKKYAKEKLLYTKKLDNLKKEKCLNNGIKLIYYSNKKYNNSIISNKDEILKVINNAKF